MTLQKKAEMGVGTLIVFIAMLLVAAVAAGVLIQTAGSLQEKSLSTGDQAKAQISTNARVIEVSAADGRDGNLTDFEQIIKLSPGSDPIKLDQVIFTFNTDDRTSTLKYRGKDSLCIKNNSVGYNTWNKEVMPLLEDFQGRDTSEALAKQINHIVPANVEVDLDDDGLTDYMWVCAPQNIGGVEYCPAPYNNTDNYLVFNLSTAGLIYVRVVNDDGSVVNLSDNGNPDSGMNITRLQIASYGFISAYRDNAGTAYAMRWTDPPGIGSSYFRIFKEPYKLDEDYDDDGLDDEFAVNDTHAIIILGSGTWLSVPLGVDISAAPSNFTVSDDILNTSGDTLASIEIDAKMTQAGYLPAHSVIITPYDYGQGYFSAVYEQDGTNFVPGNLQRGDILRVCYEAPGEITEDSLVRINFIPKIGTPTLTQFVTPDVISTERIYLYP